jgi:F-type H+-transporting ATPase subunit b
VQVDWLTVAAQIVNFLVLVYLLRRFLFRPVVAAMAARERGIGERLQDAARREQTASERAAELEHRLEELARRREDMLDEARAQADAERRRLVDAARDEIAAMEQRWREELAREQREFAHQARRELAQSALIAARSAVAELANTRLEDHIVESFLARIDALDADARAALVGDDHRLSVITATALDENQSSTLAAALRARFGARTVPGFVVDPQLVCGIEIRTRERRVGWNIADYLDAALDHVTSHLDEAARAGDGATRC